MPIIEGYRFGATCWGMTVINDFGVRCECMCQKACAGTRTFFFFKRLIKPAPKVHMVMPYPFKLMKNGVNNKYVNHKEGDQGIVALYKAALTWVRKKTVLTWHDTTDDTLLTTLLWIIDEKRCLYACACVCCVTDILTRAMQRRATPNRNCLRVLSMLSSCKNSKNWNISHVMR